MHAPKSQFNINLRCGEFNDFIWYKKIVQKCLQRGHTQMKVDYSTHSTIELTFIDIKKCTRDAHAGGGGGKGPCEFLTNINNTITNIIL